MPTKMSEKRARKKNRRYSESHPVDDDGKEQVTKKRRQFKSDNLQQRPDKLVVSLNSSLLKTEKLSGSPIAGRRAGTRSGGSVSRDDGLVASQTTLKTKFKDSQFSFCYLDSNKKKRWRNYKQLVLAERAQKWKHDDPTFTSIDAPPPLKPPKKYADVSGMPAKYTDPLSGMHFSSSGEYELIRTLPSDIIQGYLAIRGKVQVT